MKSLIYNIGVIYSKNVYSFVFVFTTFKMYFIQTFLLIFTFPLVMDFFKTKVIDNHKKQLSNIYF